MATTNPKRSYTQIASALLMLLALLWLTISIPFVYASQQDAALQKQVAGKMEKDTNNPLAGTNEEKSESGVNTLNEFLHETVLPVRPVKALVKYEKCHAADIYLAFHPELLCPPPNTVG